MKAYLAIASLAIALTSARADELTSMLGTAARATSTGGTAVVEYCPDNTCESFSLQGKDAEPVLRAFALAYFFGASDYAYLDALRRQAPPPALLDLFARYRQACALQEPRETARCIAGHLASQYPIRASFVRYDEGKRISEPILLERVSRSRNSDE